MIEALWLDALLGLKWPEKLCVVVKQGQTWCNAVLVLRTQTVSRKKKKKCQSKMILPAAELDLLTGRMGWCFFTSVMPNPDPTFQNIAVETTAHRIRRCFSTGDETTCHRRATQKLPLSPAFFQRLKPAPWLLPSTNQQGIFTHRKWHPAGPSSVNPWEDSSRAGRIWKYANGLVWQQPLHATFKVRGSFWTSVARPDRVPVCLNAWHHGRRHEIQTGVPEKVTVNRINHTWLSSKWSFFTHVCVPCMCVYIHCVCLSWVEVCPYYLCVCKDRVVNTFVAAWSSIATMFPEPCALFPSAPASCWQNHCSLEQGAGGGVGCRWLPAKAAGWANQRGDRFSRFLQLMWFWLERTARLPNKCLDVSIAFKVDMKHKT